MALNISLYLCEWSFGFFNNLCCQLVVVCTLGWMSIISLVDFLSGSSARETLLVALGDP